MLAMDGRVGLLAAVVAVVVGCAVSAPWAAGDGTGDAGAGGVRVGVYNSRGVALAYGRSEANKRRIGELAREHQAAEAAGDEERCAALAKRAEAWQYRMHTQVFGNAPIDDIVAQMADDLPRIAREAGVVAVVSSVAWRGPGVETVDVTREMMACWGADAKTLGMLDDLLAHPPVTDQSLADCCEGG